MLRVYRPLEEGEFIVIGVDTAAGGTDYCAAQFLSVSRKDVPMVYHARELASSMTPKLVDIMTDIYFQTAVKPTVAYERQNGGVFEIEHLQQLNKANQFNIYQSKVDTGTIRGAQLSPKLGWDTTSASRPGMLAELKEAIDGLHLTIYDRPTLNELFSFVVVQSQTSGTWKAQAENGMHDDLVMSLGIAWQLFQTESIKVPQAKIVKPKAPNEKPKAPYVDNGQLIGTGIDKLMENAVKDSLRPRGDWRYR